MKSTDDPQQLALSQIIETDDAVGISTSHPLDAKLTVEGIGRQPMSISGDPNVRIIARFSATDMPSHVGSLAIGSISFASAHNSAMLMSDSEPGSGLVFVTRPQAGSVRQAQMTITGDGNVGIGTTSPQGHLDVNAAMGSDVEILTFSTPNNIGAADGNISRIMWRSHNAGDGNQYRISSIASILHNGTFGVGGDLAFYTKQQGSDTAPSERMRINKDGNVGIGTTAPGTTLDVNGAITYKGMIGMSSRTLKQDIRELAAADAVAALAQLRPTRYAYRSQPDEERLGFIAEEAPPLVSYRDRKGLDPMEFAALLTKVVQEQQKAIRQQQQRIERLESRLAALHEARLRRTRIHDRPRTR